MMLLLTRMDRCNIQFGAHELEICDNKFRSRPPSARLGRISYGRLAEWSEAHTFSRLIFIFNFHSKYHWPRRTSLLRVRKKIAATRTWIMNSRQVEGSSVICTFFALSRSGSMLPFTISTERRNFQLVRVFWISYSYHVNNRALVNWQSQLILFNAIME